MSSSTSVCRVKERGGVGSKIPAQRPHKTLAENHGLQNTKKALDSSKKPAGKENTRSALGAGTPSSCQKPAVRRLAKAAPEAAVGGKQRDTRLRWSTSTDLKVKASNLVDSSRTHIDLRSGRISRASGHDRMTKPLGRSVDSDQIAAATSNFRVLDKCHLKKSSSISTFEGRDVKPVCSLTEKDGFTTSDLNSEGIDGRVLLKDDCKDKVLLASDLESTAAKASKKLGNCDLYSNSSVLDKKQPNRIRALSKSTNSSLYSGYSFQENGAIIAKNVGTEEPLASVIHIDLKLAEKLETSSNDVAIFGSSEKNDIGSKPKCGQVPNKYRSALHEKLSHLEDKVQRIASDIKRTKEILDMNHPEASKVMLLDIQEKISGIEEAMIIVKGDRKVKSSNESIETSQLHSKHLDRLQEIQEERAESLKISVESSNHDETEAMYFSHHKLLRNRALGNSAEIKESIDHKFPEMIGNSWKEKESSIPVDEDPIAIEFLASLNKKHSMKNIDSRCDQSDCSTTTQKINTADGNIKPHVKDLKRVESTILDKEVVLTADENLENFCDQESSFRSVVREEFEDSSADQLREIGRKSSSSGWFVNEGESVLLAHDDGSCSFHDVTNDDEKAVYKPPSGVSHNLWGDCWLIRAAGLDGISGKYVVAASAGDTLDAGFCSWEFYTKQVCAFHVERGIHPTAPRSVLAPLPSRASNRNNNSLTSLTSVHQQCWYKPSGPLLVSASSGQTGISMYDIRDGDLVMMWKSQRPVLTMDHSSPLQWRNRGKVVVADMEAISLWDVNSLNPQSLLSIAAPGKKVSALHINNTEAELGGGVRQRVSSSEAEGNDGVFCTQDAINVFDFRISSGVGMKISRHGLVSHSISSHREYIFLGSTEARCFGEPSRSLIQQFSLRKGQLVSSYPLPASGAHPCSSITQVWGDSNFVLGLNMMGLFVFDTLNSEGKPSISFDHARAKEASDITAREIVGPSDLHSPSFDYLGSRVLLISRDCPALCKYLS